MTNTSHSPMPAARSLSLIRAHLLHGGITHALAQHVTQHAQLIPTYAKQTSA